MEALFPQYAGWIGVLWKSILAVLLLMGCTNAQWAGHPTAEPIAPPEMARDQEPGDRLARYQALALLPGVGRPIIEDVVTVPSGGEGDPAEPVHVVHLVFDEGVLFDFDRDDPRNEALPAVDLITRNIRQDLPGTAVTIIGHTDAVGSNAYNMDLSRRRASNVMSILIDGGVAPAQLSTVAVGMRQPIAPNSTADGRARNRRVEFLISDRLDANLEVVRQRVIQQSYLRAQSGDPVPPVAAEAAVLTPLAFRHPNGTTGVTLQPSGQVMLAAVAPEPVSLPARPAPVITATPRHQQKPIFADPLPVEPAPLGPPKQY